MPETLVALAAAHAWMMERRHLDAMLKAAAELDLAGRIERLESRRHAVAEDLGYEPTPYELAGVAVLPSGLALVPVRGTIVKEVPALWRECQCEACGCLELIAALGELRADPAVKGALLVIESPGGTVAGAFEAADALRAFGREKPLHAAISDLGASAAYLFASQAQTIAANATAHVGSIGVYTYVVDSSEAARAEGYRVILIASGEHKGVGVEGVPIPDAALEPDRQNIADLAEAFVAQVMVGRGETVDTVRGWATGRTWIGTRAASLGLVDHIENLDETVRRIERSF